MLIQINDRSEFVTRFLTPVAKLSDSACITVYPDRLQSLVTNSDNSVVLYSVYEQANQEIDASGVTLNVPNINKFINLFSCLQADQFTLEYTGNCVVCNSNDLKFTYHLLDDGILTVPSINIKKIKALTFDTNFILTKDNIMRLLKASSFTTDSDKLYIHTDKTQVIGELTDKQQANVDSFSQPISMSYDGVSIEDPMSINFETLRVIGGIRMDSDCKITVHVNGSNSVFLFDISCSSSKLKYITSAYAE